MNVESVVAVAGGTATIIGSIAGARIAARASVKAARVNVDAEAYLRAQEIYEASVGELRQQVQDALAEVARMRTSVARYEGRVIQLEATLRAHRVPVPAWAATVPAYADPNQPPPITEPAT